VIGGAEDRTGDRVVLREFLDLAGGEGARVAVLATASSLGPEILDAYDETFRGLGAADVLRLRPDTRAEAEDPDLAAALADVDAVFMTGGNQLKLAGAVAGTAFGAAILAA
jgi:cyanophycinase